MMPTAPSLKRPLRLQKGRVGFTLIELLVVIAIISLLVSILLPSLTKAKDLARDTVCLSNQRNLILSTLLYADENNGDFYDTPTPDHNRSNPGDIVWNEGTEFQWTDWGLLFDEGILDSGEVGYCPRDERVSYENNWGSMTDPDRGHETSYFSRNWFSGNYWGIAIVNVQGESYGNGPDDLDYNEQLSRRSFIADVLSNTDPRTWGLHSGYQIAGFLDGSAQKVELFEEDVLIHMNSYSRLDRLFPLILDRRQ